MSDEDWLELAVLYSEDGKNFSEVKGGWYCAVTMDASIGKIDIRLIPPNRKRIDTPTRNELAVKILKQLGFEDLKEPPSQDELEARIKAVIKKREQAAKDKSAADLANAMRELSLLDDYVRAGEAVAVRDDPLLTETMIEPFDPTHSGTVVSVLDELVNPKKNQRKKKTAKKRTVKKKTTKAKTSKVLSKKKPRVTSRKKK